MSGMDALAELKIDRAKRTRRIPIWPIIAAVVIVAFFFVYPAIKKVLDGPEVKLAPVQKVLTLPSADPKAGEEAGELSAAGYIVADRQAVLASKVTGRLTKINVKEAQIIKEGHLVAEVDHGELDQYIEQTRADLAEAKQETERLRAVAAQAKAEVESLKAPLQTLKSQIEESEVAYADATRRFERDKALAESHAAPANDVEDRRTEIALTKVRIEIAKNRLAEQSARIGAGEAQARTAEAAVPVSIAHNNAMDLRIKVLETQRKDYFVYAPFDGIVTEKAAETGEIVAPISVGGQMARGSVATIAECSSLQAEVDVAETYIGRVKEQGSAAITIDAMPDKTFAGKVERILPHADRSKATVKVRVAFKLCPAKLLPDMSVRVRFLPDNAPAGADEGKAKDKLVVPVEALSGNFVWTVDANKLAHKTAVKVGEKNAKVAEILEGLEASDKVVVEGLDLLQRDGQKVRTPETGK